MAAVGRIWSRPAPAEYGYDQATVWENADYDTFFQDYAVPDEVRANIGKWFIEHCGMNLQG